MHILIVIVSIVLSLAMLLLDHFPASIVEHSFMACFRNAMSWVFIHLLPVNYSVSSSQRSMSFRAVNFILWSSIWSSCYLLMICLLWELTLANRAHIIDLTHLSSHISHHLIHVGTDVSEPSTKSWIFEKWIIGKWVFASKHTSKSHSLTYIKIQI